VSSSSPSGICRSDVHNFTSSSFDLVVRHSKTIQFGQRVLVLPFVACPDPRVCPVRALWSHLTRSPVGADNHVFSFRSAGRVKLLTHAVFVKKLKELIVATGRNPMMYSAHSFRRGGSTFAFSVNMPLLQVKARGDWKSNCFERYIDISSQSALESAALLCAGAAVAI
jgi:hypothetical protein